MNAMEHGNEYRADRPVSIRVLAVRRTACACRSPTRAARPSCREPRRRTSRPSSRADQKPRGWGLFLIEKMVDEARVTGEGGRRTLELVLRLQGGDDGDT